MTTPLSPLEGIQKAIYAKLTGDVSLMSLITGVFDEVPEGQAKPYVVLGDAIESPDNNHGQFGRQTVETLHVWTQERSFKRALEITSRVIALLDHQPLTVAGHRVVSVRYEFSQTLRDPEPEIRHVPIRFRVTTEQD